MKKLIYLLPMLIIAFGSCVNSIEDDDNQDTARVTIRTSVYTFSEVDTKATLPEALTRLSAWIISNDGKKISEIEQTIEDSGFGAIETNIPYGEYTLVIVGHSGGKSAEINAQKEISFQEAKLTDTFLYADGLTVEEGKDVEVSAVMKRAIAKFTLHIMDAIPEGAAEMVMTIQGGGTVLNATTGLATTAVEQMRNIAIPASYIGKADSKFSFYIFMPEKEKKITINTAVKNEDGDVLYERAFTDVPMKINQLTTYSGELFKAGSNMSITLVVTTEWDEPVNGSF